MTIDITALDALPETEPTAIDQLVDLDGTSLGRCSWTCSWTCLITGYAQV